MNNIMQGVQGGDPLFNMTSCPDFNDFIYQLKAFYSMEISEDEFRSAVGRLDDFRRKVRSVMEEQLRSNVLTPLKKKAVERIKTRLESFKSAIGEIYLYFKDSNREHIESGVERCRRYIDDMSDASAEMIEEEKAEASKYSKAPAQNEIMRIANDVKAGRLSSKILGEKISSLKKGLKAFYASMGDFPEEEQGGHYLKMHIDEFKAVIKDYVKGLDEAESYVSSKDLKALDRGIQRSAAAAEILFRHQENMINEKRTKACLKCGTENDMQAKYCSKCNALMPEMFA